MRENDQQLDCGQRLVQPQQAAFVTGLHQLVEQRGGGGEADRHPLLAGGQTQAEGDVGLAGPTGPEGVMSKTCLRHDDVPAPGDPFAAGEFQHLHLVQLGDRLEVEAFECRELRGLDAPLDHPPLTIDQFQLDQAGEELDMIQPLGGALACLFLIFPQEGGQLQRLEVMGEQDLRGLGHSAASDIRAM